MTWITHSRTVKYRNRFMEITEDVVTTDHGDQLTLGIVHKKPCVIIIPWDGSKFTLVGQYRYAIDRLSWEFPAGHLEHKNIETAARSELEEESGLIAECLNKIGIFAIAPGHHTQLCHVFLATELKSGKQNLEIAERGMLTKHVTPAQLRSLINKGEIIDGLTLASLNYLPETIW